MWGYKQGVYNPLLKPCPWCGSKAWALRDTRTKFYGDDDMGRDLYDYFRIECSARGCNVACLQYFEFTHPHELRPKEIVGYEDPLAEGIVAWNAGDIRLHLHVTLPDNHYVVSRRLLPTTWQFKNPSEMSIVVAGKRGIADKFKEHLSIVMNADGTFNRYRFTLIEGRAQHLSTRLTKIGTHKDGLLFTFETDGTNTGLQDKGTSDAAWLRRAVVRPPINDMVFNIMSRETEIEDEEY